MNKRFLHSILFLFSFVVLFFSLGKSNAFAASSYTVSNGNVYSNGTQIQFRGVNWSGFEGDQHALYGLNVRNFKDMISQMKSININALRIPVCPDTFHGSWVTGIDYGKNPEFSGLDSAGVLNRFLQELNTQQMYFILDFHSTSCYTNSEKWYDNNYSETQWLNDLKLLATNYSSYSYFAGIDLKNEPHISATWGTGNVGTDWNTAAEKGGAAILSVNPNLLIFVDGIGENPGCQDDTYPHFWGSNFEPYRCTPINTAKIPANKLVFSPHVYGPDVYLQWYFTAPDYPQNLTTIWSEHFGFLADQGKTLIPGEWGGKYGSGDYRDVAMEDNWVNYMSAKGICNSFYWTWNPNSGDTGGLLMDDWYSLWSNKLDLLKRYYSQCSSRIPGSTATPTPAPTSTPVPSTNAYVGEYYNNKYLSGSPAVTKNTDSVNFDWGGGSPDPAIGNDNFSARWTRSIVFDAAKYRFTLTGDDGIRLYIDNNLVIDKWFDQAANTYTYDMDMAAGNHTVKIEYYENGGNAVAKFSYAKITAPTPVPTTVPPTPPAGFTGFTGNYYNNKDLSGSPVVTKFDNSINFDWGGGSPDPLINNDNFSVRWTKTETFQAGNYNFTVTADDGFKLYIDDQVVLDKWFDQAATTYNLTKSLTQGSHNIKMEYYENGGGAVAKLSYNKLPDPTQSPTPTPTPTTIPPTTTPTPVPTTTVPPTTVPPTTTPPAPIGDKCVVTYSILNDWGNGHTANVIIKNLTGVDINGWTLNWVMPINETIRDFWQGIITKDGQNITAKNEWYNPVIPNNSTQTLGFNVDYSGTFTKPTNFTLNGYSCKVE